MYHMNGSIPFFGAVAFGIVTLACGAPVYAQEVADGLSVSGSLRLRYEVIDGQARTGFNSSDDLVNARTDVFARYRSNGIELGLQVFDSRVWGGNAGTPITTNEVDALEPVQAYIAGAISEPFGKGTKLTLTAGRMTLNLGSRRLVAADEYRNTTNGYTGVRADIIAPNRVQATLIYTLPQVRLPDGAQALRDAKVELDKESFDLVLWGGLLSRAKTFGPATVELSYFHLGERDAPGRPTRDRSLNTFGGRIIADPRPGKVDFEIEALYQTGEISTSLAPTALNQSVAAGFVHADIGYTFAGAWKPRLSVELDRASGDQAGGRYGRFYTYFGMRRADLAPAGLYNAVARTNLITPGIRLEATPNKRWDWFAVYRAMWLDAAEDSFSTTGVRDGSSRSGDFAGNQIEARIRYWLISARLRFEFDGLLLAKGRFLRDAPNAPSDAWTKYGSFNLTASF
jgi:hypothetical protein